MEMVSYMAGASFPMALLIFVGSYFGIWKRRENKLPTHEAVKIFFALWVIAAILIILFKFLLSGQDEVTQSTIGNLWGPLIVGIIIGRNIVDWRHRVNNHDSIRKTYESDES